MDVDRHIRLVSENLVMRNAEDVRQCWPGLLLLRGNNCKPGHVH